jgi:alkylation response protein AidB-like acyl-CoA dehydrogenase
MTPASSARSGRRSTAAAASRAARAGAPFLVNNVALAWAGPIILHFGTEVQKRRFLAKLLRADEIWCQGFSEPRSGSDLAWLRTRAVRDGDVCVIDDPKVWTSFGRFADYMILLARGAVPRRLRLHRGLRRSPLPAPGSRLALGDAREHRAAIAEQLLSEPAGDARG